MLCVPVNDSCHLQVGRGGGLDGLERRAMQIAILAVELSTAVESADLERAARHLRRLREEVELAETAITARIPSPALPGGGGVREGLRDDQRIDHRESGQLVQKSRERVLTERMIAVLVQLATLKRAVSTLEAADIAIGPRDVEDLARLLHDQIGRLNAAWLWGKRVDPVAALSQAAGSLRAIGEELGVIRFLEKASRSDSALVRAACAQLAALLEVKPPDTSHRS